MKGNLATVTRILALCCLASMFVTDYMFNLWAKEIPREAYMLLSALALGVDIQSIRDILINAITKMVKPNGKD